MPKSNNHRPAEGQRELRVLVRELRAVAGDGENAMPKIVGYAAVFDEETVVGGWYREVIRPGAFTRAIREKQDVVATFEHDMTKVLGRTTPGTLTLSEDATGLAFEITPPDTTVARDLIVSMQRGDVRGASFDFIQRSQRWTDPIDGQLELREILDVDLYDVSIVTDPQYARAEAELRSRRAYDDHRAARERVEAENRARALLLAELE